MTTATGFKCCHASDVPNIATAKISPQRCVGIRRNHAARSHNARSKRCHLNSAISLEPPRVRRNFLSIQIAVPQPVQIDFWGLPERSSSIEAPQGGARRPSTPAPDRGPSSKERLREAWLAPATTATNFNWFHVTSCRDIPVAKIGEPLCTSIPLSLS